MSKIDTQGMSLPGDSNSKPKGKQEFKPATVTPRRILEGSIEKELKILINEVLDERDGKRGISYFDTQHFKHYVGEEEPPYERWE